MAEINLMDRYPRSKRPIVARGKLKLAGGGRMKLEPERFDHEDILFQQALLAAVRKFGREYFDGDRLYGYGGYHYDPRFWTETVKRFHDHYNLQPGSSVLDVGCGKGFMLHDFKRIFPDLKVAGLDISEYAYEHAMPDVQPFMRVGDAQALPYDDKSFDLVVSISTVSNLPLDGCRRAIREIERVARGKSFITVHAWKNEEQRENLMRWNLTAQTCMHVDDWARLFRELDYTGDYHWFIAE